MAMLARPTERHLLSRRKPEQTRVFWEHTECGERRLDLTCRVENFRASGSERYQNRNGFTPSFFHAVFGDFCGISNDHISQGTRTFNTFPNNSQIATDPHHFQTRTASRNSR
jgi:hypothetical protein